MGRRVVVDEPTIRDILRRLEALENARGETAEVQMSVSRSNSPTPEPAAGLAHLYLEATAVARSILPSSELLQTLDNVGASIQNFRLKPRRSESSSSVQITDTQAHRWITGTLHFS